jgi:anthranilate synthase component 1
MHRSDFDALAQQGYNRIALVSEALADLETPLSLYLKLTQEHGSKNTFLLESVVGGERFGRYSIIGLQAKTLIQVSGGPQNPLTQVITDGEVVETDHGNP